MTAEVYLDDYLGALKVQVKDDNSEKRWLINEIVKPQLPNVIENIEKCLELLHSETVFKIPMSNGSEDDSKAMVRGILSRQQSNIVDFQALVKFPQFHKGKPIIYKMKGKEAHFKLLQLEEICRSLTTMKEILCHLQLLDDVEECVKMFGILLSKLTKAINMLENPPRHLLFPDNNNDAVKTMIQNPQVLCESTHHLVSIELVLFKNEVMIDFRNLLKVTKKPWNRIDEITGHSFVDNIRNQLRVQRNLSIKSVMKQVGLQIEEPSLMGSLMSRLNSNDERVTVAEAQEFLNRCVTFDGRVVMECERVSIRTSDPTLISVSSKLNGLATRLGTHYMNLKIS